MRASIFTLLAVMLAALPTQTRALSVLSASSLAPENAEIIDYSKVSNTLASTIASTATGGFGVKIYTVNPDGTLTERTTIAFDDAFGGTAADLLSASSVALDPLGRGFGAVALIPILNNTTAGKIAFFDFKPTTTGAAQKLKVLDVGFHPDCVKFTPDGTKLIVANEGEVKALTLTVGTAGTTTAVVPVVSTVGVVAGMEVYGANIPASTTVLSVDSATQVTLSAAPSAALAAAAVFNVQVPVNADAPGSISIIDLTGVTSPANISAATFTQARVTTHDFQAAKLGSGVSIANLRYTDPALIDAAELSVPGSTRYRHIEPEFLAPMNDKVYVTLQENNAIAEFTYTSSQWTAIRSLGTITQTIDASDQDGPSSGKLLSINDTVAGLPMPDAISVFEVGGQRYLVTANEGDARPDDADINRVGSSGSVPANKKGLPMDPTVLASGINVATGVNGLSRLNISLVDGDTDTDGDIDVPTMIGIRSFSIWNATTGALVWDSGSLESTLATIAPAYHNMNNGLLTDWDTRSDDKGPEPEALTIGNYGGSILAFVGMERQNGLLIYNITNPTAPAFIGYQNHLDRSIVSPESVVFVPATGSPSAKPMLLAGFEGTGLTGNGIVVHDLYSRNDVLVYKQATARSWNQDDVYNPTSPAPITRNPQAGVMKDNAFLIVDRTTRTVKTIKYYERIADGAKIKEYTVDTNTYAPWAFTLPAAGEMEFLETLAPGTGMASSSFKQGETIVADNDFDFDGDSIDDRGTSSKLSYLIGPSKDMVFGKAPFSVTSPKVAAKLTGVSREVLDAELGDVDGAGPGGPVRQLFFRSAGAQTATLDTVITTQVMTVLPAADTGLVLGDIDYATKVVIQALDKLGYDAADPLAIP